MAMKLVDGAYQWDDGTPIVFFENMDSEVEECGVIILSSLVALSFGEWQSERCDIIYPYVCEKPDPEVIETTLYSADEDTTKHSSFFETTIHTTEVETTLLSTEAETTLHITDAKTTIPSFSLKIETSEAPGGEIIAGISVVLCSFVGIFFIIIDYNHYRRDYKKYFKRYMSQASQAKTGSIKILYTSPIYPTMNAVDNMSLSKYTITPSQHLTSYMSISHHTNLQTEWSSNISSSEPTSRSANPQFPRVTPTPMIFTKLGFSLKIETSEAPGGEIIAGISVVLCSFVGIFFVVLDYNHYRRDYNSAFWFSIA
ncbi:hypothetical protein CAPTEDRAFT_195070 [Capitella teleta]|uniref:C-type lectin domain-containing protein n=1 Tax=Capitella teleta TaxID=283909 RepID=R7TR11_CAPTE|nr:hypothetical protein CAPTEDRAFT_195070 [Capitella teleta]|eukprot:ELT96099.1 hypothetical protein CAPTEDRAFT_195070 [Capitella teleta]